MGRETPVVPLCSMSQALAQGYLHLPATFPPPSRTFPHPPPRFPTFSSGYPHSRSRGTSRKKVSTSLRSKSFFEVLSGCSEPPSMPLGPHTCMDTVASVPAPDRLLVWVTTRHLDCVKKCGRGGAVAVAGGRSTEGGQRRRR